MRKAPSFLPFLFAAILLPGAAAKTRPFGVKDFLGLPILASPSLSPDGSRAAYLEVRRDLKKDTYHRRLHLVDLSTGKDRLLTRDGHDDWGAFWSRDGKVLYFFSNRGGKTALYANRFDGADPRKVAGPRKGGIASPAFSPDGKLLAFLAPPKGKKGWGKDPQVRTTLEDRSTWPQLWVLDLSTGKEKPLTNGKVFVYDFDWAPDGKRLAFTADPKGSSGVTEDHFLALVDLSGKVEILSDLPAHHANPRFSPDGKRLSFTRDRHVKWGHYVNVQDLFVLNLRTRRFNQLTASAPFDLESGRGWTAWSPDGRWIRFLAGRKARIRLYEIPASGGKARVIGEVPGSILQVSLDDSGKRAVFTASDFSHPSDLFVSSLAEWAPKRLTKVRETVAPFGFHDPIPLSWKSPDGLAVEGFLFLPPGLTEGKKAPMVVEIHGGPAACWLNAFTYRYLWHVFASNGWATLIPNVRGSTTYGEKFLRANLADFGGGDFQDMMSGVEAALATGSIDKDRLAISGYSYGGFMVNMTVTKTAVFKAAVGIAGGFNFLSCFCQGNPVLPEVYYDPLGSPAKMNKTFQDSPIANVFKVRTPLLLMHGTADQAVNHMQSIEYFNALQELGKPSKLVLYPGEGHGINKPSHMVHYMTTEIDWIRKWIE